MERTLSATERSRILFGTVRIAVVGLVVDVFFPMCPFRPSRSYHTQDGPSAAFLGLTFLLHFVLFSRRLGAFLYGVFHFFRVSSSLPEFFTNHGLVVMLASLSNPTLVPAFCPFATGLWVCKSRFCFDVHFTAILPHYYGSIRRRT